MPGLRQPLSAHIQQIRNDLRERYKGGFPILKELLQNADDAGGGVPGANASEMVLLLAPGIPHSRHILLQTPGLCLLNDGDFTAGDAISISSYGSSNRGSQSATVGRFGLGLKSVFHWAEAFFYFSPAHFAEPGDGCPPSDLLHPWISRETGQGFHKDWDQQWADSKEHDHAQFEAIARALLKSERWFGLWIPFRAKSLLNGVEPVLPEWPLGIDGQDASYESLFGADWEQRVSEVLPLLRRLRGIRFCRQGAGGVDECLALSVEEPSRRMSFLAGNGHEFPAGPANLDGKVSVRKPVGAAEAVSFAGIEKLPGTANASYWQNHRFWPRPFVQTDDGGEEPRPEKAAQHGAVAFVRQRAAEGQVRIQPAVFLPLGEPETRSIRGGASYGIFLHGHFFVDSGRRDIERFDALAADTTFETVGSEDELRQLWNRTLMRDVVAPLVLPSLDAFVRQEGMEVGDIEALVGAMARATALKPLIPWMCGGQRFILRLLQTGSAWERQTWTIDPAGWLELPAPDFPEVQLFSLMPALGSLSNQIAVSLEGKPHLADSKKNPASPSDEELAELLGSVPVSAFSVPQQLVYLMKLIPQDANERKRDSVLTDALVTLANRLIAQPLPTDENLAKLWKQFFKQFASRAFVRLPAKSTEASQELSSLLEHSKLPVALLWQDFRDAEGSGAIDWSPLLLVLTGMGALAPTAHDAVRQLSCIAVRLLEACAEKPADWTGQIRDIALFAGWEPDRMSCAVNFDTLQSLNADGRLFSDGEQCVRDLAKAAPELKPLLVQAEVAEVLKLEAPACDAQACAKVLRNVPRLASDFSSRRPLFERLVRVTRDDDPDSWAAIRSLLHGEMKAWDSTVTLFDESSVTPVLLRLLEAALAGAKQPWRRIAASVAGQLGLDAQQRHRLGMVPASVINLEMLLREVGPRNVDCATLCKEDCDSILLHFDDLEILRQLNIHETVDGLRTRIAPNTYIDNGTFRNLPEQFNAVVSRLRDRPGYARFRDIDGFRLLSWEAVIEIALGQSNPSKWWDVVLTALGKVDYLRADLRDQIRGVPWLPLIDNNPATPSCILHLRGAEDELCRLPAEVLQGRKPLLMLAEAVRNHERFEKFKALALPAPKDALGVLAQLLSKDPRWATGLQGDWTLENVTHWITSLGSVPPGSLPLLALVNAISSEDSIRDALPEFLQSVGGRLSEGAYAHILITLAASHAAAAEEARLAIDGVLLRYLGFINSAGAEFARRILTQPGVCLRSTQGNWKPPGELAFACNGLTGQACLCNEQAESLSTLRPPENVLVAEPDGAHFNQNFEVLLRETPRTLRSYFASWRDEVASECIGAFLAVLGDDPGLVSLAGEFLGNRSLKAVRQDIDANSNPGLGKPLQSEVDQYRFACVSHDSRQVRMLSVVGTRFSTQLAGHPRTMFLGGGLEFHAPAGNWYRRTLHVIRIRPQEFTRDQLTEILLNSTSEILYHVYCHRNIRLWPLWRKLSQSSQLHIRIAQNRVVDAAQAFLRQVGAHRTEQVQEVLKAWDTADRRRAEAEENGHAVAPEIATQMANAKTRLRELLANHPGIQKATLAAVRNKIAKDYGYEANSVPFELWQNADDALVELGVLGHDCKRAHLLGFVVHREDQTITFAHWGRLINEFQGADGRSFRDRGFDEDLEKMVVQSISDKRVVEGQGAALTGKFGLGFKSVFLVTDTPCVLSGSLNFAIRGGIYPALLTEGHRTGLEKILRELAPQDWRRGTVIQLPRRTDVPIVADEVIKLFRRLSPLLVVFSRRLKRVRFHVQGEPDAEMSWFPESLADNIDYGSLEGLEGGNVRAVLVLSRPIQGDLMQFMLGLEAQGFVPVPDYVPTFWVTAPTRSTPAYGFAVNGPFEPDVGRVQLALQSSKNSQLAGDLAGALCARLCTLFGLSTNNWQALRSRLHLAPETAPQTFWESLWHVLGCRFADKCRKDDSGPVATLARRILWGSEADGIQSFYRNNAALPTGLWGDYRSLTRLTVLRHVAAGALDREQAFLVASGWPAFKQRVTIGSICSESGVASTLSRLGVCPEIVESVHLAKVLEWELGDKRFADPELAARLGRFITPEFLTALREGKPSERNEQEHQAMREILALAQFQAADGSWHKPTELIVVAGEGVDADEPLRAAFAPRNCQLNSAYAGEALTFFLASRPKLEANIGTMAEWIIQSGDNQTRFAALSYLLKGELKERVAEVLRARKDDNSWLWQLKSSEWFRVEFPNPNERYEILAHRLRLFEEQLRQLADTPNEPQEDLEEVIRPWTVEELWRWWQKRNTPTGDYTLEGEANWELFHGGPLWGETERKEDLRRLLRTPGDPAGKALWYRLFGYACLVSAGRTVTELRRFWLHRLNPERFWERTNEGEFTQETQEVFERAVTAEFANLSAGGEQAYFWRRVFYDIRKVQRMVKNEFPSVLLELVNQGHGDHLRQFLRTGHLPGPDQRPWIGTFGQSADTPLGFIIRELVRLGVITDKTVLPYAFYVCRPVLRALAKIGWIADLDSGYSGQSWLDTLQTDPQNGPKLMPYYDIPLLHMGITHRGNKMPERPEENP